MQEVYFLLLWLFFCCCINCYYCFLLLFFLSDFELHVACNAILNITHFRVRDYNIEHERNKSTITMMFTQGNETFKNEKW